MTFAYPYLLYLLFLLPVIFGLWYWGRLSRKASRYGNPAHLNHLMPEASKYMPAVKITLELLALAALIIAVARPRAGEKEEVENTSGIEVMIAFDVSRSMLASSTDDPNGVSIHPQPTYRQTRQRQSRTYSLCRGSLHTAPDYNRLPFGTDVSRRNIHRHGAHPRHSYRHSHKHVNQLLLNRRGNQQGYHRDNRR